jgi:hypothetical protein
LAVPAAALLCLVAAARRLLVAFAEGAALMALGDTAWPGWDPGAMSGHGASPPQDQLQSGVMDLP